MRTPLALAEKSPFLAAQDTQLRFDTGTTAARRLTEDCESAATAAGLGPIHGANVA
jgi:hypothetical protein